LPFQRKNSSNNNSNNNNRRKVATASKPPTPEVPMTMLHTLTPAAATSPVITRKCRNLKPEKESDLFSKLCITVWYRTTG
jgi:hypothetical protein